MSQQKQDEKQDKVLNYKVYDMIEQVDISHQDHKYKFDPI